MPAWTRLADLRPASRQMAMKSRLPGLLFLFAALSGALFAGVSTFDFVQHLDRQLHGIHCSFLPGLGALDASGSSGCSAALMSPWSSFFRTRIWGGLPIALPGLAVYAFLLFRGLDLVVRRAGEEPHPDAARFLVLASCLPVAASIVMGWIAWAKIGVFCKLCVGMYASAAVALGAATWEWLARRARDRSSALCPRFHLAGFGEGVVFVAVPVLAYVLLVPDAGRYIGECGTLKQPDDPNRVLVALDGNSAGVPMIEVLDPLCPACLAFEGRLRDSGLALDVHRQALLFPLDESCNWMITEAVHPGACAASEAVLCAGDRAEEVLAWVFEHQDELKSAAGLAMESSEKPDEPGKALQALVVAEFPDLAGCLGSANVRNRINRSLRWAVANQLPVLMPQVFVEGVKLCDEDTDLGMDFALSRMLEGARADTGAWAAAAAPVPAATPSAASHAGSAVTVPADAAAAPESEPGAPADAAGTAGTPATPEPAAAPPADGGAAGDTAPAPAPAGAQGEEVTP